MLQQIDWLLVWQAFAAGILWFVAVVFLISGVEDLIYDVGSAIWHLYRWIRYAGRERLSLEKLRSREEQHIAVVVPAWNESAVIGRMVENILARVEYRNYAVFVGTYPNDAATQEAVDALAANHPRIIKVVTSQPGPTTKADCLNNILQAIKEYEKAHHANFDIVVMHDAEDVVHPYSLLLYNYLIPRVDVVQIPILPLPVPLLKWVHWSYADEFAENHMKDLMVREKMGGFVPYAGVGVGFSRRGLAIIESRGDGRLFNETTMTEDYSISKKARDYGLQSIVVNIVLADRRQPWYTPLCKQSGFISNWSYFPMGFVRAVRQKTRWIIGISLQEWVLSGWKGNLAVKENLARDRKVFLATVTNLLAYVIFIYFIVAKLGDYGLVPVRLLPLVGRDDMLYDLIVVDTCLMLFRMLMRVGYVTRVYGLAAGLLSVPRLFCGNVLNGVAAFRSLYIFFKARKQRTAVAWDKTDHQEGVGQLPAYHVTEAAAPPVSAGYTLEELQAMLLSENTAQILLGLEAIPRDVEPFVQYHLRRAVELAGAHAESRVRAMAARVGGYLQWPDLAPMLTNLLFDSAWVVRANAARALLKQAGIANVLPVIFRREDRYAWQVFIHALEQDERAQQRVLSRLHQLEMAEARAVILSESSLLQQRYAALEAAGNKDDGVDVSAVVNGATERVPLA